MQNLNTPVREGQTGYEIQKLALLGIAKKYKTPFYLYDLDHVRQSYRRLKQAISWPTFKIFYAMKANYSPAILKTLLDEGSSLDVVSPTEAFLGQKLGFPKDRILYTANSMATEEIQLMSDEGLLLNFDSLSGLERFGSLYPGHEVVLRFNPDVVAGEHEKIQTAGDATKFGILLSAVDEACAIVKKHNLKVVGIHEHTGSGIADMELVFQSVNNMLGIITKERFPDLRFVDFGGGFKVPYKPEEKEIDYNAFGARMVETFGAFCKGYGRNLELYFEPGKYMVAECGLLIVRANTLKENNGRLIAGTDSGFPQLIRPVFYNAYHHILNLSNPKGPLKAYDVCGNICESGDRFAEGRELPEIREGDYLAIMNAGGYCHAMGSIYNLRPLPTEVVIEKGEVRVSHQAPTSEAFAEELLKAYI